MTSIQFIPRIFTRPPIQHWNNSLVYYTLHSFRNLSFVTLVIVLTCLLITTSGKAQPEPTVLFLTWESDPTTSVVIEWHKNISPTHPSRLHYRRAAEKDWQSMTAIPIPTSESDRTVFRKSLTGLSPDNDYEFRIDTSQQVYSFHTMPTEIHQSSFVFAVGGDSFEGRPRTRNARIHRLNRIISNYHPQFILWSHKIPKNNRSVDYSAEWYDWLAAITEVLIDDEGRITPILSTSGYFHPEASIPHKDPPDFSTTEEMSVLLNNTLQYGSGRIDNIRARPVDFGNYLSILIIPNHFLQSVNSTQVKQIKKALRKRKRRPHLIVANSPAVYSSLPGQDQALTGRNREMWTAIYDRYEIPFVLEFQGDQYKRTIPLKDGISDPEGTIYLSDGTGEGQPNPTITADELPSYIETSQPGNHLILISVQGSQRYFRTVNEYGKIIDEYPQVFEQPVFEYPLSTLLPKGGLTLSAEIAKFQGSARLATDYSGFSRGGFAWFEPENGEGKVSWELPVHNTDFFTIRFRYAYAPSDSAYLQFVVNGEIIEEQFVFPSTGKHNRWEKSSLINLPLKGGINQLEIRSLPGKAAPRIDRIEVFPSVF